MAKKSTGRKTKSRKKTQALKKSGIRGTTAEAIASGNRPVMFAPWRKTYIKRGADENLPCVFCDAVSKGQGLDSLIVHAGRTCSVILNKYPYNNGHTMVIPHRHAANLDELDLDEFEELHSLLKKSAAVLHEAYKPHGMNIGMNLGRVAGAGVVGHLHYHLVPRWNGDTNFMPVIGGTKVCSEDLEETYRKLVELF